jgi:macrolide transport system ATP-binding/permease protein
MRTLPADLRYALRTLAHNPGFAAIAILSIALGVGANTAMFSYLDAVLLRPLPVPDSGRIVSINTTAPGARLDPVSYPDYGDLRDGASTLTSLAAYYLAPMTIGAGRDAVAHMSMDMLVSANFFSGLGIPIPVGRGFRADEDTTPGRDLVAVISHQFWEREFGADPKAVGRTIRLNGTDFTVIGVAPQGFTGPEAFLVVDVYVPLHAYPQAVPNSRSDFLTARGSRRFAALGRLKPRMSEKQAQAELNTIAATLAAQYPDTNRGRSITVLGYQKARYERDPLDATLAFMLMGITSLVLLIACANVANLVLARGVARAKEVAIRMAIGAGRGRLIRQLMTESLLLALLGGVAGLGVAYALMAFLNSVELPSDFPIAFGLQLDTRMLTFAMLASVATGIAFGLVPALRSTRGDLALTIKSGDQGPGRVSFLRGRLSGRNLLVTAQLTLSVVVLIAAGFFVRGFEGARRMNPGFRLDHTLTMSFDPGLVRYNEDRTRVFYRKLVDRVREMPGVEDAALVRSTPFSTSLGSRRVIVDGYRARPGEDNPSSWASAADDRYFALAGVGIASGRAFSAADTAASPRVAIVNETLAARAWPNRNPVGQRIQLDNDHGPVFEVVGVAANGKYLYWAEPPQPYLWTAFAQDFSSRMTLEVRTAGDPASMSTAVRDEVRKIDPDMPVFSVRTMDSFYEKRAMLGPRLLMQMVTTLGLMALLLAVIGLYGVVAYAVSRRSREIGIRMAIGARPGDVLRMVLGQGLGFTIAGLALGLAGAFFLMKYLTDFAVGVSAHDPAVFLGVSLVLAAVMMAASWVPAHRASRVDPTRALRTE